VQARVWFLYLYRTKVTRDGSARRPRSTIEFSIGDLNIDFVLVTDRIPDFGESNDAISSGPYHGGKGANTAVAAVRASHVRPNEGLRPTSTNPKASSQGIFRRCRRERLFCPIGCGRGWCLWAEGPTRLAEAPIVQQLSLRMRLNLLFLRFTSTKAAQIVTSTKADHCQPVGIQALPETICP
jgi:hypothetical protein